KKWIFNYEELKKLNPDKQKDGSLKQMRDVWQLPLVQGKERIRGNDNRAIHPTQKPIRLAERALKKSTRPQDIVLDIFGGSGSTLIACEQMGRRCFLSEIDPYYCDVIIDRWEKFTGREAVKV
ncbi:MAG: site-specific DNA-methyltransferase, partial [Nanoarchaeota archaeon]|nr:site-specific DNA-methyltransferase [Nanoarchaeota archaeon]